MKKHIKRLIVPYMEKTKQDMKLPSSQRALCIMDNFSAQCTDGIIGPLESNGIDTVYFPAKCTGKLQPMDNSVNKPVKIFLKDKFQT